MEDYIAIAKPLRGREMRSTVIPRDVMEAVRAVSLKGVERTSLVDQLETPRKDDCEVYHEGYIDGKLYLVPDSNLQAMRDIVNLKMKRKLSSASEQTPTVAPEQKRYIEFNSRLNSLVNKVDRLALGSEHQSVSDSGSMSDKEERVPPILDKNIRYKKVRHDSSLGMTHLTPFESLSKIFSEDFGERFENESSLVPEVLLDEPRLEAEDENMSEKLSKLDIDIYRILLTGHIVERGLPKIIVNLHYAGSDIFENLAPDFKQHEKDGNIDVFVTGKFFTENILDESADADPCLKVGSNKVPVDDSCEVHEERFSDIFDVGPIDILLEGEFVKNPETLKYVPTFSLEILKKDISEERFNLLDIEPTRVMYAKDHDVMTPFDIENVDVSNEHSGENRLLMKGKHVHYADVNDDKPYELKAKSLLGMIKGSKIFKKIILRKEENCDDTSKNGSRLRLVRKTSSRIRREALVKRKLKLKGREKQAKIVKTREEGLGINHQEVKIYHTSGETKSPFQEKHGDEQLNKKKRRRKKEDSIVNNPILAQMQEFFIT